MSEGQYLLQVALSVWSIRIQFGIVLILAALFFLAWIFTRRKVLGSWTLAWVMDAVALAAVLSIAGTDAWGTEPFTWHMYTLYAIAKIMFAGMLMIGLNRYRRVPWAMSFRAPLILLVAVILSGLLVRLVAGEVVQIQTSTDLFVGGMLFISGFSAVVRGKTRGARVVGLTFFAHGIVFLHHFVVLWPTYLGKEAPAYMSRISFVDAVSEFLVGLGCVLALGIRAVDETKEANRKLEASEQALRNLVDADPLTGLYNRRRLRNFLTGLQSKGVMIFIDLDGFKAINDGWGHGIGDACLVRVAEALRHVFRSDDGLFRLGGDEFLVVASGLSEDEASHRILDLRKVLASPDARGIPISLSVGMAPFDDTRSLEHALAQADEAMYREKQGKRARLER